MPNPTCVSMRDLEFSWGGSGLVLSIRKFDLATGEKVFLHGASGSGKSTLLGLIAGVFAADSGALNVVGTAFHEARPAERDAVRADAMGVVFQLFNLVPYLTLIENVLLPCRFSASRRARTGATETSRRDAALRLLERLGLGAEARDGRSVSALSVGQQQRVAAARAVIGRPSLIIADEPTSALDAEARDAFIETLLEEAREASMLFVSHDAALAERFDRVEAMADLNEASARLEGDG